MYDYTAAQSDELTFHVGDCIEILEDKSNDWWKGKLNGKTGMFPMTYIEKKTTNSVSVKSNRNTASTVNAVGDVLEMSLTYEEVMVRKENGALEISMLEAYLTNESFHTVFGIPREEFIDQPKWKQNQQKKKHKLF